MKTAGTNPIHNKQKKKAAKELDEDELAFKAKQQAGSSPPLPCYTSFNALARPSAHEHNTDMSEWTLG